MKHSIYRTSQTGPGQKFLGTCANCGTPNLPASAAMDDCPNQRGVTQDQSVLEAITGRLGDDPVESAYVDAMNLLMRTADDTFNGSSRPKRVGVVMLVFPYEDISGRCNFISNGAAREDLVVLFKELISRFEGQPEISGKA